MNPEGKPSVADIIDVNTSQLLNALRGGSALVVAYVHGFQVFCLPYFGLYGFPHLASSWFACYAVIIFFIVSGFMIAISVRRHTDASGFKAAAFFRARVLRIYPPLLAAIALCLVIYAVMHGFGIHGIETFRLGGELFVSRERVELEWSQLLPTLLLIYTIVPGAPPPLSIDGPLWTLVYEWWFYLLAMFAAVALLNRGKIVKFVPLVAVFVLFAVSPAGTLLWVLLFIWLSGYALGWLYARGSLRSPRMPAVSLSIFVSSVALLVAIGRDRTLLLVIADRRMRCCDPGSAYGRRTCVSRRKSKPASQKNRNVLEVGIFARGACPLTS